MAYDGETGAAAAGIFGARDCRAGPSRPGFTLCRRQDAQLVAVLLLPGPVQGPAGGEPEADRAGARCQGRSRRRASQAGRPASARAALPGLAEGPCRRQVGRLLEDLQGGVRKSGYPDTRASRPRPERVRVPLPGHRGFFERGIRPAAGKLRHVDQGRRCTCGLRHPFEPRQLQCLCGEVRQYPRCRGAQGVVGRPRWERSPTNFSGSLRRLRRGRRTALSGPPCCAARPSKRA